MDKQFKTAEGIYLDYNNLERAMEMYQDLHKWDEGKEVKFCTTPYSNTVQYITVYVTDNDLVR